MCRACSFPGARLQQPMKMHMKMMSLHPPTLSFKGTLTPHSHPTHSLTHSLHGGACRRKPGARKRLAVPFRAALTPSERSEFAQPDVALVLTHLSYYQVSMHTGLTCLVVYLAISLFASTYTLPSRSISWGAWVIGCCLMRHSCLPSPSLSLPGTCTCALVAALGLLFCSLGLPGGQDGLTPACMRHCHSTVMYPR